RAGVRAAPSPEHAAVERRLTLQPILEIRRRLPWRQDHRYGSTSGSGSSDGAGRGLLACGRSTMISVLSRRHTGKRAIVAGLVAVATVAAGGTPAYADDRPIKPPRPVAGVHAGHGRLEDLRHPGRALGLAWRRGPVCAGLA